MTCRRKRLLNRRQVILPISVLVAMMQCKPGWCGQYIPTQLPSLADYYSQAFGINNNGLIVGRSNGYAVMWDSQGVHQLPGLGVQGSDVANSINDSGMMTGTAYNNQGVAHAMVWQSGSFQDLGVLNPNGLAPDSAGLSINNNGQVVGFTSVSPGSDHGFVWTAATGMQDLGSNFQYLAASGQPGIDYLYTTNLNSASAINNSGTIVGSAQFGPAGTRAVIFGYTSTLIDDFSLSGFSTANAINSSGILVGAYSSTSSGFNGTAYAAFAVPNSPLTDLAPLNGGSFSNALAISDPLPDGSVDVVGESIDSANNTFATLWTLDPTTMTASGPVLISPTGYINSVATGVNDQGQIVGYGTLQADGILHAFLLTPGPGSSQINPVLPTTSAGNVWDFNAVASGDWFDPATAYGYDYEMTSGSLFTDILGFPTGFSSPFDVYLEDGTYLGSFQPGDTVTFPNGGTSGFMIEGLNPFTDPNDPSAFPVQLAFDTPTADFTITALSLAASTPEPGTLLICGIVLLGIGRLRRR